VIDVEKILLFLELPLHAQRGSEVNGLCPMHKQRTGKEDRRPSWWINTETGAHICFSCGYKGNIYTLIADVKGIDYHDARDYIDDTAEKPIDSLMKRIKELPQYVQAEPEQIPMSEARLAVYTDAPDIELKKRFLKRDAVNAHGVRWDIKNEAWILPIRDPNDGSLWGWQEKGARGRFFKNQPAGVKKSKTVFGVEILTSTHDLIVVESPLDAVRLTGLGHTAISTFGALISEDQAKIMRQSSKIIAAFDNDKAGQTANEQIRSLARKYGIELSYFNYTGIDVKDVGDMTEEEIERGIKTARTSVLGKAAYL
jgi:DNA primase